MLGYQEIIIILIIALLVFGPAKLPEIGRQVGSALRELRKMSSDMQRALDLDDHGSSSYDRYDYDRDRRSNDRYASDPYSSDSSFEYSAPDGQTYAQGSLESETSSTATALPAPPGPPSVHGRVSPGESDLPYGATLDDTLPYPSYDATTAVTEGEENTYRSAAENGTAAADMPTSGGGTDAETRVAVAQAAGQGNKES